MVQAEYKTKWAAPLEDLPGYFQRNNCRNVPERQSIDAVHQLYGYMTFNENKYGVLSNMQYAWFFQLVETADGEGKTLQYYGPIDIDVDSVERSKPLWASFCLYSSSGRSYLGAAGAGHSQTPDQADARKQQTPHRPLSRCGVFFAPPCRVAGGCFE